MAKYPDLKLEDISEDLGTINKLESKFQAAKDARKSIVTRWRRNEELYMGKILKPFNLPKYKTRIEPNIVHSVVETMQAILTDRPPKVDVMPKTEAQMSAAYQAQDVVDNVMSEKKAQRAVAYMKRDGLIYGNGFIKPCIVNGELEFIVPDVFTVFVDPLATSIENAKCVIFATPTYIEDIKEKYGKTVASEGKMNDYRSFIKAEDSYATDKAPELGTEGPLEDKTDTDYRGGMAILKEAFYYEEGVLYLATWAGKTLLQREEAPYDFIPLVTFKNYSSAHSIWGKGEPEVIESLAVGSSIALSQGMDNLIYHGNPAMVMSKSLAKITGNRPTDKPGQIFYTNGPHERIDRLPAGNISSSTLPMAQSMIQMADQVSGVHEVSRGVISGSVSASRAIQQLQEASQQIIRAKEREIGTDAIVDLYKMTLSLLAKNYAKVIEIRKNADDGSGYMFIKVNPYDLDPNMDYKYVPGSSMPESRANRMDQAIQLLQMGLLDEEGFWRWTQVDITKDKLDQIAQMKAARDQQIGQEMQTISESTNEDEIMESLLRYRQLTGTAAQQGGSDAETPNNT